MGTHDISTLLHAGHAIYHIMRLTLSSQHKYCVRAETKDVGSV